MISLTVAARSSISMWPPPSSSSSLESAMRSCNRPRVRRRRDHILRAADHHGGDVDAVELGGEVEADERARSRGAASWDCTRAASGVRARDRCPAAPGRSRRVPCADRSGEPPRAGCCRGFAASPVRRAGSAARPAIRRAWPRVSTAARCHAPAPGPSRDGARRTTAPRCRPSSGPRAPRRRARGQRVSAARSSPRFGTEKPVLPSIEAPCPRWS